MNATSQRTTLTKWTFDSMEDAVADAIEEEDTDEFFRRIRRIARGAGRVARRAAPIVGRIARGVSRRQGHSAAAGAGDRPYRRRRGTRVACR